MLVDVEVEHHLHAVAVIAESWWQAKRAVDALPVTWDEGPNAKLSSADIHAMLVEGPMEMISKAATWSVPVF